VLFGQCQHQPSRTAHFTNPKTFSLNVQCLKYQNDYREKKKILNMDTLGEKKLTQEDGRYEKCAMMQSIKPLS